MINIEFVRGAAATSRSVRRLSYLDRATPGEIDQRVAHGFSDGHWIWSPPEEHTAWYVWADTGLMPNQWAYAFSFDDGSRGVCMVRDLNEALAALGYEIDRRGDEEG